MCRDDAATAHLAVTAAGPLKLQLSQLLAAQRQQQLQEGEAAAAAQQHAKALALARDTAQEMQAAGAPLLRLQALQLAAQLLLQDPQRQLQQEQYKQQQQAQQQQVLLPLDESPLLLEARRILRVRMLTSAMSNILIKTCLAGFDYWLQQQAPRVRIVLCLSFCSVCGCGTMM